MKGGRITPPAPFRHVEARGDGQLTVAKGFFTTFKTECEKKKPRMHHPGLFGLSDHRSLQVLRLVQVGENRFLANACAGDHTQLMQGVVDLVVIVFDCVCLL